MSDLYKGPLTPEQVELNRKWISALRSGDYKQGHGVLYDPTTDSYCCLGVACVVAGHKPVLNGYGATFDNEPGILPERIKQQYGLAYRNGRHRAKLSSILLSELNDTDKAPFNTIADIIEAELELVTA